MALGGEHPMLIEVKSTKAGPFHSFGPAQRAELYAAAKRAGAEPWLVWWPPRGKPEWIGWFDWPNNDSLEAGSE